MAKAIGPSFIDELRAAGLEGLPFAWGPDGRIEFDSRMTQVQIDAVGAVLAAHDPAKPASAPADPPAKATLKAKLDDAIADGTIPNRLKAVLVALKATL